jgi:hypothetical protein
MSTEENKTIVRRYVEEVINKEELAAVDELFASDHVLQDPNLGGEKEGSAVMAGLARLSHMVSPDYKVHVEEMVAEGDKVIISWTARGKLAPDMGDPGPTGDEVTVSGISMFRLNKEGKISYTKQLSRSLDDYPRPVPKEEAARERLASESLLGPLEEEARARGKCWIKPWTCHWRDPDQPI